MLKLPTAHAGIECWTNKDGVRECGDSVPPQYSQQRIEEFDKHGVVIKVRQAAKTKAQLKEEARRAKAEAARKKRAAEQARQDEILLDTFTSEQDITMARDDKINAIEGTIKITQSSMELLKTQLQQLQKRAADIERAGKKPPQSLIANMSDVKQRIKDKQSFVQQQRKEQDTLRRRYAADLKRFRELKSGKSGAVSSSDSNTAATSATADPTH